jgi:hypothetical protein
MVPHFLLRSAGFPIELLGTLAFDDTAAAVDRMLDRERELTDLAQWVRALLADDHDAVTAPHRRRWWRCVRDERSIGPPPAGTGAEVRSALSEWDSAVAALSRQRAEVEAIFGTELAKRRTALREIVADERFCEAVWLSSPPMLERGVRAYLAGTGGPSALRRIERQLVAYLQRFCAKNDTAAFFGPIGYGVVGNALLELPGTAGAAGSVGTSEAFVASWAVLELAAAVAADAAVRPHLVPRRSPMFRIDHERGVLELPGRGLGRLTRTQRDVLGLVDGRHTVADIAELLGYRTDAVLETLDPLAGRGVVRLAPEPPVTEPQPIAWLGGWVDALPGDCPAGPVWQRELASFRAVPDTFPALDLAAKQRTLADLEARFTRLTGAGARRGSGGFYVDRLLVYEEAATAMAPLRLSDAAAAAILAELRPIMDIYAGHACFVHSGLREHGARRLRELADDGRVPLLTWIEANHEQSIVDSLAAGSPWRSAALAQLAGRHGEAEVELDPAGFPSGPDHAGDVLVTSPDLFLLAPDEDAVRAGRMELVIGECHDGALLWGWPLRFHPDAGAVRRDTAEAIEAAAGGRVLASVLPGKRVKITPYEYPGPSVELAAPSTKPAHHRVPAAEVSTRITERGPVLHADAVGEFTLHNGELHTVAHQTFGQPRVVPPPGWTTGAHTPRLRIGKVVVQRERWQVSRTDLFAGSYAGDSPALLADYRRAARRLGLPRYLFARAAGERKPVFVDGHSWFLVQLLYHLFRDDVHGDREVVLTEMLPAPDQLWLAGPAGRFCAELRFTLYHQGCR